MNITTSCLMLTCVVLIGLVSTTLSCPTAWPGNPGMCGFLNCSTSKDCDSNGVKGSCCRTTCGGMGCFFESSKVKIEANDSLANHNPRCPLPSWIGETVKLCKSHDCSSNEQCVRNGVKGDCCRTVCSGHNCYFSRNSCPEIGTWPGNLGSSCSENRCVNRRLCTAKGVSGICCQTSCGGHHCFPRNATSPITVPPTTLPPKRSL